jgi:hypothetical protein
MADDLVVTLSDGFEVPALPAGDEHKSTLRVRNGESAQLIVGIMSPAATHGIELTPDPASRTPPSMTSMVWPCLAARVPMAVAMLPEPMMLMVVMMNVPPSCVGQLAVMALPA